MDIFFIYSVKENVKYSIKLFICGGKRIAGIPYIIVKHISVK